MQSAPANSLVVYKEKQLIIRNKTAKKKAENSDWMIGPSNLKKRIFPS
jgi:hypothetical protein